MSADKNHAKGVDRSSLPVVFKFDDVPFRSIQKDDKPWFVADDLCTVLEHTQTSKAVSRLDEDEKGVTSIPTPGGEQQLLIVNESGLYSLILTSRKPQAKRFKRWITHEVLPALRKTGRYDIRDRQEEPLRSDPRSGGPAHNRLSQIFADSHLEFDHLLKALFGDNIPYTQSLKYPLFLTECCAALGISETAAAGCLQDAQIATLTVGEGDNKIEKRAVTEAALIFLAFARHALGAKRIANDDGRKNVDDWVHIPKSHVGRFILTILPNGSHHLYRSDYTHILYEADQMNCLAMAYSLKTVEAFWRRFQQLLEFGSDAGESHPLLALDGAITTAARHADHFIDVYTRLADSPNDPRPRRRGGNGLPN